MKTKTYWLVFLAFFLLAITPVMLWNSTTTTKLEHKIIEESPTEIKSIIQYEFGEYGLLIMGQDESGKGDLYALVRLPGLNKYWVSEKRNYSKEQTNAFAVRDLSAWVALSLDHGELSSESGRTGVGYLNNLFLRLLIAAAIASVVSLIIDKKVRKNKNS